MKKKFYKKSKYKQILRFREPIHESTRILNFKRPKWQYFKKLFISKYSKSLFIKKFQNKKLKFQYFYPTGYSIPNRWINLRFNYKEKLLAKNKLAFFYGLVSLKRKKNLLLLLESRLDIILWRANFFKSPAIARFYINHKNVFINSKVVNLYQKTIKTGDIITFSINIQNQIKKNYFFFTINKQNKERINIIKKKLNNIFPFYLELNGDILTLIYFKKLNKNDIMELVYLYSTNLNIEKINSYFK